MVAASGPRTRVRLSSHNVSVLHLCMTVKIKKKRTTFSRSSTRVTLVRIMKKAEELKGRKLKGGGDLELRE
jgi:hypothetical protein